MRFILSIFILLFSQLLYNANVNIFFILIGLAIAFRFIFKELFNNPFPKRYGYKNNNLDNQFVTTSKNINIYQKKNYYINERKIPSSDLKINKIDVKTNYILKVLRYVKNNEPKWAHSNWSKTYKESEYNQKIKSQLWNIFESRCCYCGEQVAFKKLTLDHVYPRQKGGSNRILNLLFACRICNSRKGVTSVGEFILKQYSIGEKVAPWFSKLLKNKSGRKLLKELI